MIDAETAIVKVAKPAKMKMVMLLPDVKRLPHDPKWEKIEHAIVLHSSKKGGSL